MSRSGVMKWIREGKIKAYNVNGRWKIPYSEIERLLKGTEDKPKKIAIYARVSGYGQKDDLERQVRSLLNFVKQQYGENVEVVVIKDIGSGINPRRRGLKKLIELVKPREIDTVVVAYKDRLTRFGFEFLEELFKAYGVNIVVAFQEEPKDYMQELVEDLITIVTSFASRLYGRRSKKYQKAVNCVADCLKDN